jgi:GT2 family glycosyltransferase
MISIVIPTFQHFSDCLKPCVESLIKYTDLNDIEIIVVANGCKDGTKEYIESLGAPFKLLWFDDPIGYTRATNEGIKVATGDYLVLLNNDTAMLQQEKNWWVNALKAPFSDPAMGITGIMMNHCPHADRDFLVFFCVMVKREVFDKIGLLDEAFSPGFGEDTDFCCRETNGWVIPDIPCRRSNLRRLTGVPVADKKKQ